MLHAGPYPKLSQMKRSPSGTWDDKDEHGEAVQVHGSVVSSFRPGLDFSWHEFLHHCRCVRHFQSKRYGLLYLYISISLYCTYLSQC